MVYAPLTRCRALGTVPCEGAQKYYKQRALKGGLMITEATTVSATGHGYPNTPGIFRKDQVNAWGPIVSGVHEAGGVFFVQLWHVGRASHPDYQPGGAQPLSCSDVPIPAPFKCLRADGSMAAYPVPRPLTKEEIQELVQAFADAAENAIKAGFDGVEIHGANGYLIEQFFRKTCNKRTDDYGGSIPNRCRFCLEIVKAVTARIGADRVGLRLSPYGAFLHGSLDDEVEELVTYLVKELAKLKLVYLHCVEPRAQGHASVEPPPGQDLQKFRKVWPGPFLAAGGYNKHSGDVAIEDGTADLITYGRFWLSTPDLPERFAKGAPINHYDRNTFYSTDPVKGYSDYPFLDEIPKDTPTYMHYSGMEMFK
ncbi:hypothetical protein CVIRNUC_003732 [Coccomyxa viridis]|uniref:NADH:flavin oxidoreductase/NADH oxidase N-terminal domain-containing protein n=1 Tax=Coccomyxa viridis TaxID=1274662 RepID=A0AAV1I0M8_9CHLO|nr:hypothetical protein CVIRNUC_003732 [Coccomyxa viridis]